MIQITWKASDKNTLSNEIVIKEFTNLYFMRDYLVDPADAGENNGTPVYVSKRLMKFFHDYLINSPEEFYEDDGKLSKDYVIMEKFSKYMLSHFDWEGKNLYIICKW